MRGNRINIYYNQFLNNCSNSLYALSSNNNYVSFFQKTDDKIKHLLHSNGFFSDVEGTIYNTFSNSVSHLLDDGISYINVQFSRDSDKKEHLSLHVVSRKHLFTFLGLFYIFHDNQFGEKNLIIIKKQNICKLTVLGIGKEYKIKTAVAQLKRIKINTQIDKIKKSEEKAEFLLRKAMKHIGWRPTSVTSLYTEPSICLENLKFLQFQKTLTDYVIDSLNQTISTIGRLNSFSGMIKYKLKDIDYMDLYYKLLNGQITCKDVCDIIYRPN